MKPLPEPFTPKEWHAISLCVGWTAAMSDKSKAGKCRLAKAQIAMSAFRRTIGETYHARIMERVAGKVL